MLVRPLLRVCLQALQPPPVYRVGGVAESKPKRVASTAFGAYGCLQLLQSNRTKRCASTPIRLDDSRNGSTPMSLSRVTAPPAMLESKVDNTRWPVRLG